MARQLAFPGGQRWQLSCCMIVRSHRSSLKPFVAIVQFTIVMHLIVRRIKLIFDVTDLQSPLCTLSIHLFSLIAQSWWCYHNHLIGTIHCWYPVSCLFSAYVLQQYVFIHAWLSCAKKTGWLLALCKMASSNHYIPKRKLATHCQVRTLFRSY